MERPRSVGELDPALVHVRAGQAHRHPLPERQSHALYPAADGGLGQQDDAAQLGPGAVAGAAATTRAAVSAVATTRAAVSAAATTRAAVSASTTAVRA